MDEEGIEKAVLAYLRKKGFKQTELALQEEQSKVQSNLQTDADVANKIHSFIESEDVPTKYVDGYRKLRSWTYSSLDLYKHELLRVLYPVFVHCFLDLVGEGHIQEARTFFSNFRDDHEMMHMRDLRKLEGVLTPSHLEEMEFAHTLRQCKVGIKICQYSYELLLQYLHKAESLTILGIINEHINFQVFSGQPISISDDVESVTLLAGGEDAANMLNQKEIHWGLLEDALEDRLEKSVVSTPDAEKIDGESKKCVDDESKRRLGEGGKASNASKKLKKDKIVGSSAKTFRPETSPISVAPRVKPDLPMPMLPEEVELAVLEDLRNRVQLNSLALPSVSFYTFINAHNQYPVQR